MNIASTEAKPSKHDFSHNAHIGKEMRSMKDAAEEKYIAVANIEELMNNSLSMDRIKIRGNIEIAFNMSDIPEMEIEGDLRCKNIVSSNGITVVGDIKADCIRVKQISARNIACSVIEADDIAVENRILSNNLYGKNIKAKEIRVTEKIFGQNIDADSIYASDVNAYHISSKTVESKSRISCEILDSKNFKAHELRVSKFVIKETK
ncbi:MAG: hypothetical protein NTY68_01515 [Candidatus Micrarchaeota archaeon]|nr:hypothetical protein [Candidatus Micrarchaeota archaeon]